MEYDFSTINKIVERNADRLVAQSKELHWPAINTHKTDYFNVFQNLINKNDFWIGHPDSFKVAACLIAALLEKKVLHFDTSSPDMPKEIVLFNYRLAVNVALEFLSCTEIHTYTANSSGKFVVEQTHPNVNLSFPTGIIEAEELYTAFCKSLAFSDLTAGYNINIPSISIILHLLYCHCFAEEKKLT